jgi:hypothetical protein
VRGRRARGVQPPESRAQGCWGRGDVARGEPPGGDGSRGRAGKKKEEGEGKRERERERGAHLEVQIQ